MLNPSPVRPSHLATGAALFLASVPALAIIEPPDETGVDGTVGDITIIDSETLRGETGWPVDDTFSGTIEIAFTLEWTVLNNGTGANAFGGLQLFEDGGERIAVGDHWGGITWGVFQEPDGDPTLFDGDGSPVLLATDDPRDITMTLEYTAGGDDVCTILFAGGENVYTGDFSFDSIRVRVGNGTTQRADFTDISLETPDSDGDGLPDSFEQGIILAAAAEDPPVELTLADIKGPADAPEVSDYDGDGLSDAAEFAALADPLDTDSDDDGLEDGVEDGTGTWVSPTQTGTEPADPDSDGDGLSDGAETNTGTFVDATDTGTDPNQFDTDGDGANDGLEVITGSDPLDDASTPPSGDLALVGADDFSDYGDGPLDDQVGGEGFDFDNDPFDDLPDADLFVGHTGTFSDWDSSFGAPEDRAVTDGVLSTREAGIRREYNGPGEGEANDSDEFAGAFNDTFSDSSIVYYRVDMTRGEQSVWSGISSYEFDSERLFFGVPNSENPDSEEREFGLEAPGVIDREFTGISPQPGETYTMVAKIDLAEGMLSMWINPDLEAGEAANPPDASAQYAAAAPSTAFRLASTGPDPVTWDNLVVAREWSALGTFPSVEPDPDGGYATWITGFPGVGTASGFNDDADGDGVENGAEHVLGTDPSAGGAGLVALGGGPGETSFRHSLSNSITDGVGYDYEWSTDLVEWFDGASGGGLTVDIATTVVTDNDAPQNDEVEVTATVTEGTASRIFVRLRASQN